MNHLSVFAGELPDCMDVQIRDVNAALAGDTSAVMGYESPDGPRAVYVHGISRNRLDPLQFAFDQTMIMTAQQIREIIKNLH